MNEELTRLLKLSENAIASGASFVQQQAPILCEQVIKYNITLSILNITLIPIILMIFWSFRKKFDDVDYNINDLKMTGKVAYYVFGVIGSLVGIVFIIHSFTILLQCFIAPKLFLLNYLKGLM